MGRACLRSSIQTKGHDNATEQANTISPIEKPPVASLIMPKASGPKYPPRLPTAPMIAIPAAAALPDRFETGRAQNGGIAENTPIEARVKPIMTTIGLPACAA